MDLWLGAGYGNSMFFQNMINLYRSFQSKKNEFGVKKLPKFILLLYCVIYTR